MTDCPPQRLQALRWGFRETLQHVSRLPSYSEFQAHFSGDGVPDNFREALYQLYAQFLKRFESICTEEFENILREHDIPQVVQKLDEAEQSSDRVAQQLAEACHEAEQAHYSRLQRQVQVLREAVQQKSLRIRELEEAKVRFDQQQAIDKEAFKVLCDWNERVNPNAEKHCRPGQQDGKHV